MTTTILLIRHGLTDWNAQGRWQGHADVPLNKTGAAQAQALAQRLSTWPIQAVISSDLKRAAMTAVPLANALNKQPVFDPIWRERDVGDFSGLTRADIRQKHPDLWQAMRNRLIDPPNGETHADFRARAVTAFDKVLAQHDGEMVAVVSHGWMLVNVISHVLEVPPDRYGNFRLDGNTSLSIVTINEQYGQYITLLNDTSHLE